nr:cytochrome b6 [Aster souliei]UGK72535.1 cytochrome b6 [Aster tongolensis]
MKSMIGLKSVSRFRRLRMI